MYVRFLIALFAPLSLLFVLACGGSDSSTSTPSSTATAAPTASPRTPSASPAATPNGSATAIPNVLATPSRSVPPSADHVGLFVLNFARWYNDTFGTSEAIPVECPYDSQDAIIDCSTQGYGRIAVDPAPTGAADWVCRALLTPDNRLVAASCTGTTGQAFALYGLVS